MAFFARLQSSYRLLIRMGEFFQSPLLLLMRLYWGFNFAQAGWGKLLNIESTATYFGQLGIPLPQLNAYFAGGIEFLGGVLLLVGLASRLAAIPLIFVMGVAYVAADRDLLLNIFQNFGDFVSANQFNYLLCSLVILIFGPGKISLDYFFEKLFFNKKT